MTLRFPGLRESDKMAVTKVPANLPQLVKAAFSKARHNGDLLYFQTQVTILKPGSHPVRSPTTASRRGEAGR